MTECSRRVLAIAQRRAQDVGAREVSPEHLLFALAAESDGVASHVLRQIAPDSEIVRIARSAVPLAESCDLNSDIRFHESTSRIIAASAKETKLLNHNYIGTEHLILGLASAVPSVIEDAGILAKNIRREVYNLLGHEF